MIFEVFVITLVIFALYHHFFIKKKVKLPPGPRGLPLVGNMFSLMGHHPHLDFKKWGREFGQIFTVNFGPVSSVMLGDVKLVKQCFNDPNFNGRDGKTITTLLTDGKHGIVNSDGPEWVEQRRFALRHLRDFGFGKNYMESLVMEEVHEFTHWIKNQEGNPINIDHKFELAVLNSLWFIITGSKFKHDDTQLVDILKDVDEHFMKPTLISIVSMLASSLLKLEQHIFLTEAKAVVQRFNVFFKQIIQEHQDTLPKDGSTRDFIDAYLQEIDRTNDENSSFYKEDGMRSLLAVISDLFLAGTETTSATLSWTMLYLTMDSDVQKKLQKEIDKVVGSSRPVTLQDKANLHYSMATIEEALRMSSVLSTGLMHLAMEDTTFCGYDIPKGMWVMPNTIAIHHNPDIWGDPQNFRPERFLEEDPNCSGKKIFKKNENLLPFSLGKRACIGEQFARDEIFLFMTNIFQRFTVSPDPSRKIPDINETKGGLFLKPAEFHLIMKERLTF